MHTFLNQKWKLSENSKKINRKSIQFKIQQYDSGTDTYPSHNVFGKVK